MTEALLYYILEKVGLFDKLKTSTGIIAKDLGISQQTVSRKLRELEKQDMIKRIVSPAGMIIRLRNKSVKEIRKKYYLLKREFEKKVVLLGTIKKGIGEGGYYMEIYSKKIKDKLGFNPFPGTLNLEVDPIRKKEFLSRSDMKEIEEFTTKSRTYGAVYCYHVNLNEEVKGALIIPVRARHPENIIEIIAPVNLKNRFNLKDGNSIKIT